jgi:DNA-binding LacI/PurR family transcriptional regulator
VDVARRAGVSKGAVSFALNDRPGVAPETRDRILAAARELGWQPSTRARALSRSRAYAVASSYRRLAGQGRVDGVFLNDMLVEDHRFDLLAGLGLPAVAVGRPAGPCPFPMVTVDDRQGVAQTVEHLLGLGHRRIAFVGGTEGYVHSSSRRAAWRQALEAARVAPGPELVGDFTGPGGAAATRALLDLAEPPTAIVYANDVMAIAGMGVAIGLGLQVPGDLSVTGFDDVPLAAHVAPPLTTVRQDALGWGRAAAEVLLAVGEGRPAADVELPPATPVFRASTGPPRPA